MKYHDTRLSVHHVGGRRGSRGFPIYEKFEKDIVSVLYDADADCLPQIQEFNRRLQSELHVLPYCLGASGGAAQLNINFDPYTSSLLDMNPDYGPFVMITSGGDYPFSETFKTMEKRTVELVTIDQLKLQGVGSIPPPDFLSIDTQGSEYEILQGARETLQSNVLGLLVEVEFHPVYKNQKLFGDVTKLLADQGFHFVRFWGGVHQEHHELSPFRAPIGLRGEGFQYYADALYLRRLDSLGSDGLESYIMLQKLAFIAVIFNQLAYALQCLKRGQTLEVQDSISEDLRERSYYKFLRTLERKAQSMPNVFPKGFASTYTFEASRARFQRSVRPQSRIKESLRRVPKVFSLLRRARNVARKVVYGIKRLPFVVTCLFARSSGVETVLIDYGLKAQAKIVRGKRLSQSRLPRES